jgi:undecaprenyl diphosphate synthase
MVSTNKINLLLARLLSGLHFRNKNSKRPERSKEHVEKNLKIPLHLGVIMDGNGRWAEMRHLPRSAGHRAGAENLKELCRNCGYYGVRYLTVYAFSTENWSRPEDEVHALMELFVEFFERYDPELEKEGIRVRFSGEINGLPEEIQEVCQRAEKNSIHRKRMDLIIAMNYGGRREITQACRDISQMVLDGVLSPSDITEATVTEHMYLPDVPDPDLIIRPSGELRLSNFLVWEAAYTELWVSDTLWPDFGFDELTEAFAAFSGRDRRFGGLTKGQSKSK